MIEISPFVDEADEQNGLGIFKAVWPHDPIGMEEARSFRESLRDHVDLLAHVDGTVGGCAIGAIQPEYPELILVLMAVLPALRRRGAGSAFLETLSAWAGERGLKTMESVVADNDTASRAFWTRRGFVEDRRQVGIALDLTRIPAPMIEPPDGVEIVTWAERPELAHGIYEVVLEAVPDIPGRAHVVVEPFEGWLAHDMQGPGSRPDATFVAVVGDEVVGYATFSLSAGSHSTTARHGLTGVKRAWRGRGVARALKAAQIAWAKANGYEELRSRNDERNAPIRRLNDEFGYRPTIGRVYLKGPLV
jgi:GNAT superfamily N-acetyltransferase